jgi:hypothetical protein
VGTKKFDVPIGHYESINLKTRMFLHSGFFVVLQSAASQSTKSHLDAWRIKRSYCQIACPGLPRHGLFHIPLRTDVLPGDTTVAIRQSAATLKASSRHEGAGKKRLISHAIHFDSIASNRDLRSAGDLRIVHGCA